MQYLVVENNKVSNIIDAPEGFTLEGVELYPQKSPPIGIDWTWNNGNTIPPVYEAPEIPDITLDPKYWWIDVGPFYDRFGVDGIAIAASDNGICKAVQTLTGVRKYIDLKDPKVSQMIDMLIAAQQPAATAFVPGAGPITAAKKAKILNTPTTEAERFIKGM